MKPIKIIITALLIISISVTFSASSVADKATSHASEPETEVTSEKANPITVELLSNDDDIIEPITEAETIAEELSEDTLILPSDATIISFPSSAEFIIKDSENNIILSYFKQEIKSDKEILSQRYIDEESVYEVSFENTTNLTYIGISEETNISFVFGNDLLKITGDKIERINITSTSDFKIKGEEFTFLTTINRIVGAEAQVVSVTGFSAEDTEFKLDIDGSFHLSSDKEINNIKTTVSTGSDKVDLGLTGGELYIVEAKTLAQFKADIASEKAAEEAARIAAEEEMKRIEAENAAAAAAESATENIPG